MCMRMSKDFKDKIEDRVIKLFMKTSWGHGFLCGALVSSGLFVAQWVHKEFLSPKPVPKGKEEYPEEILQEDDLS